MHTAVSRRLIAKGLKLFAVPVQDGENKQFVSQNSKAHKLNHVVKDLGQTQKFITSFDSWSRLSQLASFGGGGSISGRIKLSILLSQFSFEVFGSGLVPVSCRISKAPVLSK
jgi:hypothetical protein